MNADSIHQKALQSPGAGVRTHRDMLAAGFTQDEIYALLDAGHARVIPCPAVIAGLPGARSALRYRVFF